MQQTHPGPTTNCFLLQSIHSCPRTFVLSWPWTNTQPNLQLPHPPYRTKTPPGPNNMEAITSTSMRALPMSNILFLSTGNLQIPLSNARTAISSELQKSQAAASQSDPRGDAPGSTCRLSGGTNLSPAGRAERSRDRRRLLLVRVPLQQRTRVHRMHRWPPTQPSHLPSR